MIYKTLRTLPKVTQIEILETGNVKLLCSNDEECPIEELIEIWDSLIEDFNQKYNKQQSNKLFNVYKEIEFLERKYTIIKCAIDALDFDYDEDKFRVAYANYNNKNVKANFMKMIPSKLMVEDVNVYYDNGEFKVNHNGGGDCISKNAILVDNYFCCVEG